MKVKLYQKTIYSVAITAIFFSCFSFVFASEISKDAIIQLVNQSRTENNVQALNENQILDKVAQDKLDDMIKNNYFAHTSPAGIAPWHWFDENKYDYKYAGENLALGFSSVESEHQAWMDSPTHKKNILNPNFKEIGIAVGKGTIDNNLVTIAVQEFGAKMENGVFKKEENNISDDKSKDLLKENKDNNKGIVLNTESSDSNNKLDSLIKDKGSEPKISFSRIKEFLSQNGNSSAWITLITIISLCIIVNTLAALMLVFHNLINHMRKEPDIFKVVHGLLILLLVGSIIF